jgi:multiple sugar transport system ATP-binding protein
VIEALGPEQLAYVDIEASPVLVEDVLEGIVDIEAADDIAEIKGDAEGTHATVVARLDAAARVHPDDAIELAVDPRRLHFFDVDSGATIGS